VTAAGVVSKAEIPAKSLWSSTWFMPLLVFFGTTIWITLIRLAFVGSHASSLPDGFRIHDMSANNSQQTLDIININEKGISFIWYTHVYPPLLDIIRYGLAMPEIRMGIEPSGVLVDQRLYFLYAILFGIVAAIIFAWVRDLTRHTWIALAAAVVWVVSPISVTVMTLLEPTPLSMALVTASFYVLYKFLKTRQASYSILFFLLVLIASWSRNIVQLHVMVVLFIAVISFWFMTRNRKRVTLAVNLGLLLLIFFLPIKTFVMFGTWDVSSHTGYHRAGALWIDPRTVATPIPQSLVDEYDQYQRAKQAAEDPVQLAQMTPEEIRAAQVEFAAVEQQWIQRSAGMDIDFSRASIYPDHIVENALQFSSRFNTREQLLDNFKLSAAANEFMLNQPVEAAQKLAQSLAITVPNALLPITETTGNYLVESFWWKAPFEWVFSGWRYVLLILVSAAIIVTTRGVRGSVALCQRYLWFGVYWVMIAIPVAFSNRFWPPGSEDLGPIHVEAARLKSFLEIPIYVVIWYAAWLLVTEILKKTRAQTVEPTKSSP
jgi:hypothetical protein